MEQIVLSMHDRSDHDDCLLIHEPIYVDVDNTITELIGVISLDDDSDSDVQLETYLTWGINHTVSSQSMAHMKQTAQKTDKVRKLTGQSTSGQMLATFPDW